MFQRYLHDWPESRPGVRVLRNPGGGVAPWNTRGYRVEPRGESVYIDGSPIVFYHFSTLRFYRGLASLRRYGLGANVFQFTRGSRPMVWTTYRVWEISTADRRLFWHPYVREIASACDEINVVEPRFDTRIRADRKQLIRAAGYPILPAAVRRRLYQAYVAVRASTGRWRVGLGRAG